MSAKHALSLSSVVVRNRCMLALAAVAALEAFGITPPRAKADTFTYTRLTAGTDEWSTGDNWDSSPNPPTSGSTTTLVFDGSGSLPAGTAIVSDNDLVGFQLNQLIATYSGPVSNTPSTVTISGNALEFLDDGATTPAITLTLNAANGNSTLTSVRPSMIVSSDLKTGSTLLTITVNSTNGSKVSGGNATFSGALTFTSGGSHIIALDGTLTGESTITTAISDQGAGNLTSITKAGATNWTLTGANDYSGGTTISAGVLQATQSEGFGSGEVVVFTGGQAYASGDTYSNNFSLSGTSQTFGALRLGANTAISGNITLLGDSRITNASFSSFATLSGKISGAFSVTFGSTTAASNSSIIISNQANNYTGDTIITETGTSGGTSVLRLGADEVIPNGTGFGNLVFQTSNTGGRVARLDLFGYSETVNGIVGDLPASPSSNADAGQSVRNGAATDSTLTIGDGNASALFVGQLINGSTGILNVVKKGTGTQTFAGRSTNTGSTTVVDGGSLVIDYTQFAPTSTNSPSNYFTPNSDLILDGSTFAINGRKDGAALNKTGVSFPGFSTYVDVTDAEAAGLVVGQAVTLTPTSGSGTQQGTALFLVGIVDQSGANTRLYVNARDTANSQSATGTVDIAATTGSTSQTVKSLTLAGASDSNSTIDFGTSGTVLLTFSSAPIQTNDGSTLTIANWNGTPDVGGGGDQLLFVGSTTDFTSVFDQSEIIFTGYGSGYQLIDDGSFYEVVAISAPEPTSMAFLVLGGAGLLRHRRRRIDHPIS